MPKFIFFLLALFTFQLCQAAAIPSTTTRDGKDSAVFFAVDDYEPHPEFLSLRNPIGDALSIAKELREGYAFNTVVYRNPDRATIERVLDSLSQVIYTDLDQLFIFFSGHGDFDEVDKKGFFLPYGYDAEQPAANSLDLKKIRQDVEAIACPHLLLAIDACYSGLIFQLAMIDMNSLEYGGPDNLAATFAEAREMRIAELLEKKSKLLITSSVDQVSSDGSDQSPFTKGILEGLESGYSYGYGVIDHSFIASSISLASPGSFDDKLTGDEGGNFIFVVANPTFKAEEEQAAATVTDMDKAAEDAWEVALEKDDCRAYQEFHTAHPNSAFDGLAWQEIKKCNARKAWKTAEKKNTKTAYQDFLMRFPESIYAPVARKKRDKLPDDPQPPGGRRPGVFRPDLVGKPVLQNPNQRPPVVINRPPGNSEISTTKPPQQVIAVPMVAMTLAPIAAVNVKGGKFTRGDLFTIGSQDERPTQSVTVGNFVMDNTEVTNAQFAKFLNKQGNVSFAGEPCYQLTAPNARIFKMAKGKYQVKKGYEQHPVTYVSWYGAMVYCNYRSEAANLKKVYSYRFTMVSADWSANGYRLPTEAEWEFAARSGGKKEKYAGFNDDASIHLYANFCDRSCKTNRPHPRLNDGHTNTAPVRKLKPNGLGLYDMSGNVYEWCWDFYAPKYAARAPLNPKGATRGSKRVIRGGAWNRPISETRTMNRAGQDPKGRYDNVGFRTVKKGK